MATVVTTVRASPVECESRIERVVVYARGAVVTRRVTWPDALPDGPVELRVAGVTALAEVGSVRAVAEGSREVVALRARVIVPGAAAAPGALRERVRALALEQQRVDAERASLVELRAALAGLSLDPALHRWAKGLDPAARFGDALAMGALAGTELERTDALIRAADVALADNRRAREAAAIAASQGALADLAGPAPAQLEVLLRLGAGSGPEGALAIEYVVRGARWWPAYTARFTAAATQVDLALDALVAQVSGEDWGRIKLALSTADLAQDARLPELRSLRFGRAQPAPRRGYRPPPDGLEAMFAGYDRAAVERTRIEPPSPPSLPAGVVLDDQDLGEMGASLDSLADGGGAAMETMTRAAPMVAASLPSFGKPRSAAPMRRLASPPPPPKSASWFAPGGSGAVHADFADEQLSDGGAPPEPPAAIEPAEAWLDFDTLILPDGGDRAHRGRLTRDTESLTRRGAAPGVDGLEAPPLARDPLASRGRFDHRYDAEGTSDVPSTGRPHRVAVAAAEAPATPRFVAAPREVAAVFREVEIQNPFAAPLLAGPVDVFLDGALVTTAPLAFVDRAGWIRLGLGVEERIRVARNARVEERTTGLLGGSAAIDHSITVDLASSLGRKVAVEVLERVPVTDDRDVEIKLSYARPEHDRYTQADRGEPLRGGLRFTVDLPAGGEARVELGYRVTLPAKNEIVGGNRRE